MLVSLIPFFLVARLAVDESAWNHGPEYIFNLEINVTSVPMNQDDTQQTNCTYGKLFCRPEGPDSLNCRLKNIRMQSLDVANNNDIDVPEDEIKYEAMESPFLIAFNEEGIEHLIVDEHIHTYILNTIRNIVSLLSIGADLNGKSDGTFEATENSTIGLCNVTFSISHTPVRGMIPKMSSQRYELESLPNLNKVPGETIEIEKTTDLDNCSFYASFYHGTYGDTLVDTEVNSHLESSSSRVFISDTKFISVMTRKGSLSNTPYDYTTVTEKMMLSLQDIRAAAGPAPVIPNASKATITANSMVERLNNMK